MSPLAAVLNCIAVTSALLAGALFIGWHRFVRKRYAALFAAAFAVISLGYMLTLASVAYPPLARPLLAVETIAAVAGLTLLAVAFRTRSGLSACPPPLLGAAIGATAVSWTSLAIGALDIGFSIAITSYACLSVLVSAHALARGPAAGRARGGPAFWMFIVFAGYLACQLAVWIVEPLVFGGTAVSRFLVLTGPSAGIAGTGLFALLLLVEDCAVELRRLAAVDSLTDILNRRGLEQAAAPLLAQARRRGQPLAVVVADLDRFKAVNDRFGHALGDEVLRRFAGHARRMMRDGDLVGRLGGEEFVIVLASADEADTHIAIERLRLSLAAAFADLDLPIAITASYGIAVLRGDETLSAMLIRADRALYRAKVEGRDRVVLAADEQPVSDQRFRIAWAREDVTLAVTAAPERRSGGRAG